MTGTESDGRHFPVVIVGAGPTGMTAALLLGRYGVPCLVLDRWEDVYPQPRAVHLDDEVYRILGDLGLAEDFAAISRPGRGLRLCDKRIHTLAEFERDPDDRPHGYPQANMFDQPELERLMRSHITRYDSVQMRGGCEITDVQNLKDSVRVRYDSTEDGTPHWVTADYVLGCDGANSVVRRSIGSKMEDLGFEQRWLVVDIETDVDLEQWDGVHQVCDSERSATYMRIGPTRYRWEFRMLDGETLDEFTDLSAIHPFIAPWFVSGEIPDMKLIRSAEYTFRAQVVDRWRDRRVFLLGDSAHLTPPFIGQGMGAGLRDARNLVWKLVGVLDGHLKETSLDSYETERKTHAKQMIELAVAIGWAMTGGSRLTGIMRANIAPALGYLPFIGEKVTASTTPPLARSPYVLRSPVPVRTLAGKLCPNSPLDGGARLDDLAPGRFLFVSSTPLAVGHRREIERRGAVVVEVAASSELGVWLRRGHAVAAIVRPDRTVMASGTSVPSLHTKVPTTAFRRTECPAPVATKPAPTRTVNKRRR
ncbi:MULTISPECIES: bifunctional 3-(3-hydroxy-phenyl)propionate/3-hydroxycinnamic acid hydroxylase [unclassified Rhodococcus (in: high G+C Gram-positive bacteria)]|uniref:bifunctional 3-(3-hydroxy-phenyl)propionate/3-hydroxycinnamic acid hydroxylase MhpA n=1 Tax=unclassified Rhodococcus (in: high G+C Gram-positive bacteria) TaxID=192944 RepID=UPI000B9BC275|nr:MULTISPECIES: bifunctional 3-(3-hydroxy-phenyl)propionate/3-hydroxycinnamic acid hydroxylase [unclassified Rhodococcus (in: high G+C Gram-positive bacteria)]OZE40139.1 3-(3-hydroxyphenyl)propionate hydroxylase [Rhodococcus sp. 05-2254-4]OZE49708.1 3-(3-hydroxyphenyl)propionate hydroxylase [Rhodococcus sp. 05-2254-3]OZE50346.1 3-(3-hydroxyphenyl)propionate hydroxylase [Rhodococcus sp. 05-2254-2]OZF47882.1 3-(3-hydroxyphenyl)propionate hydroxylase [Rhodococcus sp. 14-1411-2a]